MFNRIKKLFNLKGTHAESGHIVIARNEHGLDNELISPNARNVIEVLQKAGYSAFLVGGGIRDILLDGQPKDFDVATNATPEQVKRLFRNALIIGRRFRIVHVRFGREIIEVTTFRAHHEESQNQREAQRSQTGMLLRDNVFGDIESDALRRDFTVNALYYDPSSGDLVDYTHGLHDLQMRELNIIGEPADRYREDPVRMLRAIRFSAKLGFAIGEDTAKPISRMAHLLSDVSPARLFDEVLKLLMNGSATATLTLLREHNLFTQMFPQTDQLINQNEYVEKLVIQAMVNTDKRIRQGKRVTPAFIYAVFLWPALQEASKYLVQHEQLSPQDAMQKAAHGVIGQQLACTSIPKRFLIPMREIWSLQLRLPNRDGKRAYQLIEHPRFRAAYDFLLLREDAGEDLGGLGLWWTRFQDVNAETRETMIAEIRGPKKRRRKRRRRKPAAEPPRQE